MEVRGIIKKRKKANQVSLIFILLLIIVVEIISKKYVYLPISFLVLLACFLEKSHIVSSQGINIQYHLFGQEINNIWNWGDLTGLAMDHKKVSPDTMVYFGKDMATRAFRISKEDDKKLKEMLRIYRPDIKIEKMQ